LSCNPFRSNSAVKVTTKDENLNSRWHANLATPAELAGAVQMNGSASMAPSTTDGSTTVVLDLANATPGRLASMAAASGPVRIRPGRVRER
jgi:hypothetical protein